AIGTQRIVPGQLETEERGFESGFLQKLTDDIRRVEVAKDPDVVPQAEPMQAWYQGEVVVGQAAGGDALGNVVDGAVHEPGRVALDAQQDIPFEQTVQVQVRTVGDYLQF